MTGKFRNLRAIEKILSKYAYKYLYMFRYGKMCCGKKYALIEQYLLCKMKQTVPRVRIMSF